MISKQLSSWIMLIIGIPQECVQSLPFLGSFIKGVVRGYSLVTAYVKYLCQESM